MHHIIYMSRATGPLTEDELAALLAAARSNNRRRDITGALVYSEGKFLQLLEGEEADLTALYRRLLRDERHTAIIKLADNPIAQRSFAGWAMAFRTAAPEQFAHLAGYASPGRT